MTVFVLAEHTHKALSPSTRNTVRAALALGPVEVGVLGYHSFEAAEQASKLEGVQSVAWCDHPSLEHGLAESFVAVLKSKVSTYTHVLAPATTFGKNILPRLAALLDVEQLSEVIKIVDEKTFVRPIYAGNALATLETSDPLKILTIRPTAFDPVGDQKTAAPIHSWTGEEGEQTLSCFVRREQSLSVRPELSSARVVVSGGRGFQRAENFKLLEALAEPLKAAVGASRAAVDAGYVSNDCQVGQTGKVVAPDLYIAIGISGAIQHLAGMKESKVIVAINKDPEAPIFKVADYGLVGDLFEMVPALTKALSS